jgi:hypothetical protein
MATPDTTLTPRPVCRHNRRTASAAALSVVAALALAVTGNAFADGSDPLPDSSAGLPNAGAPPASSDEASSLEAATQQAATAIANATQNNVQNIVVIIRINSPGDDVISQSNTANAGAAATNTSTTQQESGAGAPPVQREATRGPERVRPQVTAVPRKSGGRADGSRRAASASPAAAVQVGTGGEPNQYPATPEVAPRRGSEAAPRSASAPSVHKNRSRPSVTPVPARFGRAAARAGAGAAHFVSSLVPTPTMPDSSADKADSVSTAVVMTLLAVVLAVLLGVGSTYVPAVRARAWR